MKFIITAHPIDKELQESLRIYRTSRVETRRAGTVLRRLMLHGYTNVHSYVEKNSMRIHCKKDIS